MAGHETNPSVDAVARKRPRAKQGKRAAQRSMELLRKEGHIVCKVEHFNPFVHILQDAFGFIDLIALGEDKIIAVQVTKGFLQEHITKIRENAAAQRWLQCGGLIVVHHWRELGPKDAKKWNLEVIEVKT